MESPFATHSEVDVKTSEALKYIKNTVDSISAGEGGVTYDTLVEAQAVSPKPMDGTIFQVSNITDPDNAGFYSFQAAEPNGTRFEGPYLFEEIEALQAEKVGLYPGKNKININDLTDGFYVNYTDGVITPLAGYSITDFIPIKPLTEYTLSCIISNIDQFAIYDLNQVYIEGYPGGVSSRTFTTPANAEFILLTIKTANKNNDFQLEEGPVRTTYSAFGKYIDLDDIENGSIKKQKLEKSIFENIYAPTVLKITPTFTLRDAMESITDASEFNKYEIHIPEGNYDIFSLYTPAEINAANFIGLRVKDHVNLVGIGDKNNIIIEGTLDGSYSQETINRVSVLAIMGSCDLTNIVFKGTNCRYTIHDDYDPFSIRRVYNCDFYHYGTGFGRAYGSGMHNGCKWFFEKSYFYTDNVATSAISIHNNVGFTQACSVEFKDCEFESVSGEQCMELRSLGSGTIDEAIFIGCRFVGKLAVSESVTTPGVGNDFKITGYGNDQIPVVMTYTDGGEYVYNFQGECVEILNSGLAINKGDAVKLNGAFSVAKMEPTDDKSVFYGVAFESIAANAKGVVKISGFMQINDTNLVGVVKGDKIGITNGELAVVVSDEIGLAISDDFFKINK